VKPGVKDALPCSAIRANSRASQIPDSCAFDCGAYVNLTYQEGATRAFESLEEEQLLRIPCQIAMLDAHAVSVAAFAAEEKMETSSRMELHVRRVTCWM